MPVQRTVVEVGSDDGKRLGTCTLYKSYTLAESQMLDAHQASLPPSLRQSHRDWVFGSGTPSGGRTASDTVDFSQLDVDQISNLKAYLGKHGVPPPEFVGIESSPGREDLMSFAIIRPTEEQLERLHLSQSGPDGDGEWLKGEAHSGMIRFSRDPLNTTVRFTCPGVSLTQTTKGWMLYEGDLECGLRVPTEAKELISNYTGLAESLEKADQRGSKIQLQLRLADRHGGDIPYSDTSVLMQGDSADAVLPPGMARRMERKVDLTSVVRLFAWPGQPEDWEGMSRPVFHLLGYGGQTPRSERLVPVPMSSQSGRWALRAVEGTEIKVTSVDGTEKRFPRENGPRDMIMPSEVACQLPASCPT